VIWDFSAVLGKTNRFYLNQQGTDFDVSLGSNRFFLIFTDRYDNFINLASKPVAALDAALFVL